MNIEDKRNDTEMKEILQMQCTITSTVFHILKKESWYVGFEDQAMYIANHFFETTVLSKEMGFQSISMSKAILSRVIVHCLDQGWSVCIWEKKDGLWNCVNRCEPGYVVEAEDFLTSSDVLDNSVLTSIMWDDSNSLIGVSFYYSVMRKFVMYEFQDSANLDKLVSLLGQYGPQTCVLLTETTETRVRRLISSSPKMILKFRHNTSSSLDQLARIEIKDFKRSGDPLSILASKLPLSYQVALLATQLLLSYCDIDLRVVGNNLSIEIGNMLEHLLFDDAVTKSLSLFPSNSQETIIKTDNSANENQSQDYGRSQQINFQSLFEVVNNCKTRFGSRLLRKWIRFPSIKSEEIVSRHEIVHYFFHHPDMLKDLRESAQYFSSFPDLEAQARTLFRKTGCSLWNHLTLYRCITRLGRIVLKFQEDILNVSQVDVCYQQSLSILRLWYSKLQSQNEALIGYLRLIESVLDIDAILRRSHQKEHSKSSYVDVDPGLQYGSSRSSIWLDKKWLRVRSSIATSLDECSKKLISLQSRIVALHQRYLALLPSSKLPLLHLETNEVHGLHFRVTKKESNRVLKILANEGIRTMASLKAGTLFRTREADHLMGLYEQTHHEYEELQADIVLETTKKAQQYYRHLMEVNDLLAQMDVLLSFASYASLNHWCRPHIVDDQSKKIVLKRVRHPGLESMLGSQCIPSDFEVDTKNIMMITGPNMGGKTTFLRTLGICVILCQIGCFVPAEEARLSIFDRIFCRMGAFDSLELGRSTFYSEMHDISYIVRSATSRSLVLMDEIGRGTSTNDGFGIAVAVIDYFLHHIRPCVCIATHFHELIHLPRFEQQIENFHVDADISKKELDVVMKYEILPGPSTSSFGINVAQLVGFPNEILTDAKIILESMTE